MVFNATFNNISVISWWSVLLMEETGENYRSVASHWQTLSAFLFWLKLLNLNILVSSFHNDMVLYTKRSFLVIYLTYNMDVNEHESPSICIQLHRDIIISDTQWYPKVSDSETYILYYQMRLLRILLYKCISTSILDNLFAKNTYKNNLISFWKLNVTFF